MKRCDSYKTKQKDMLLNIIKSKKNSFTIKELNDEVEGKIGLTTIYRLVNKLEKDGLLNKWVGKNNEACYEYLEKCGNDNHFYLKCDNCGLIKHIDCDCIYDLSSHIFDKHNFKPSKDKIIINGICNKCIKEEVKTC